MIDTLKLDPKGMMVGMKKRLKLQNFGQFPPTKNPVYIRENGKVDFGIEENNTYGNCLDYDKSMSNLFSKPDKGLYTGFDVSKKGWIGGR